MRHVRAVLRLFLLVPVTTALWLAWLAGRRPAVRRLWARAAARILGVSIETQGALPEPPFLLASNHLSYLDIVVLWTLVDGDFVAKSEVRGWPVIGRLAASADTLFVDRSRRADLPRVVDGLSERLSGGRSVLVFPEGTSTAGDSILPFKPGMFEVAGRVGCPTVCARIAYATPPGSSPARTAVCWWGDMTFLDHLYGLLGLPSITARVTFAGRSLPPMHRKELALAAHRLLEELHAVAR